MRIKVTFDGFKQHKSEAVFLIKIQLLSRPYLLILFVKLLVLCVNSGLSDKFVQRVQSPVDNFQTSVSISSLPFMPLTLERG